MTDLPSSGVRAKAECQPYTGNRTARVELTISPGSKAEWARHAANCGVSLPLFIHTAVNALIENLTDPLGLKHTGTIGPDPLPPDPGAE